MLLIISISSVLHLIVFSRPDRAYSYSLSISGATCLVSRYKFTDFITDLHTVRGCSCYGFRIRLVFFLLSECLNDIMNVVLCDN